MLLEKLIYLRMYVEASIDFPEEELDFLQDKKIHIMGFYTPKIKKLTDNMRLFTRCHKKQEFQRINIQQITQFY